LFLYDRFAVMETSDAKRSGRTPHCCVIDLREMLQSVLGDDFVRLYHYGSRVEGWAHPESDYDVLCVTKRPLSRQQRDAVLDRQLDIQMDHNVLFDLHFRHEEQIESKSPLYSPYVDQVITDGIVV
jgi:uncharacterized protein